MGRRLGCVGCSCVHFQALRITDPMVKSVASRRPVHGPPRIQAQDGGSDFLGPRQHCSVTVQLRSLLFATAGRCGKCYIPSYSAPHQTCCFNQNFLTSVPDSALDVLQMGQTDRFPESLQTMVGDRVVRASRLIIIGHQQHGLFASVVCPGTVVFRTCPK